MINRERVYQSPVEMDCEVYSTEGYADGKKFISKTIGRFLIAQHLQYTDCKKTADGRLSFRFYGKVSSPKKAGEIKRQLRTRKIVSSFTC